MPDSTDDTKASTPKPAPPQDDTLLQPRLDAQGRPMVEEIDLNDEEEAALDAAWAALIAERAAASKKAREGK